QNTFITFHLRLSALPGLPGLLLGFGERVHGELHLSWSGTPLLSPEVLATATPPIGEDRRLEADADATPDAEEKLGQLIAQLTPAQREIYRALLPAPLPPSPSHPMVGQ